MNNLLRFLVSRIIKIGANSTKMLCYIFHFFFPQKRFRLPRQSPPILKKDDHTTIPNILWQTNYTDRVTLPVYINYLFNRMLSPTYEYRFMITEDREAFIKANCSEKIYASYARLQIGAAQADLWRLLVLHKYGGVYMDIDAHLVWPLNLTIKPADPELYLLRKRGGLTNYFIASRPDNENLVKIIDAILHNIQERRQTSVYRLTGPGVFNQVLQGTDVKAVSYRYTCNQGNFTNEYFQYIDKPQGKWTKAQGMIDIVRRQP